MKIIFRCDSSFSIGSGHLVRCLNLAHLLTGEIIFICRNLSGNINSRVIQNQFKLIELPDIPEYSIETKIDEINEIETYLSDLKPDLIVVDHYGLDEEWEKAAKKWTKKVIAIDDLGRKHHSDIILDQNFRSSTPQNYIDSKANLFLGPHYCLLSKKFQEALPTQRIRYPVRNILVFFGGSDSESMTLTLTQIAANQFSDISWIIVLGDQNRDINKIQNLAKNHKHIEIHVNTTEMVELMNKSDLFVGAGGTTSWERAKLGLPSIVISIAKNQNKICEELNSIDVIQYLGESRKLRLKDLIDAINNIKKNKILLENLSTQSLNLKVSSKIKELIKYIE